jgi:hypothetical protein
MKNHIECRGVQRIDEDMLCLKQESDIIDCEGFIEEWSRRAFQGRS